MSDGQVLFIIGYIVGAFAMLFLIVTLDRSKK